MGASAREIEREIRATRDRMDDNLTRLEGGAASRAVRYGRFVAIGLGALALAGIGILVYGRTRKPSLKDRLDDVSIVRLRELLTRLKDEMPSVTVSVNEKAEREPGTLGAILRTVGPAVIGTASTAVLERLARPSEPETGCAAPQAE